MFFLTFQVMAVGIHGSGSQRCLDYTSATHLDHLGGCREITPTALTLCQIFQAPFTLRLHGAVSKICLRIYQHGHQIITKSSTFSGEPHDGSIDWTHQWRQQGPYHQSLRESVSFAACQCCRTSENPWPAPKSRLKLEESVLNHLDFHQTTYSKKWSSHRINPFKTSPKKKKTGFCKKKRHLAPAPINICWPSALLAGADNRNEVAPNPGREKEMKTKRKVTSKKLTYGRRIILIQECFYRDVDIN